MSNRKNFLESTKKILAGRAGYQCSHPDCDVITIGPGESAEQISSIGEAAHIYSASINGPRGQGGLRDDELSSLDNGIWACKNHARLIDTNKGDGFSAEQLKSWKYLHEEKIKMHQGRIHRKLFWLNSLEVNTCKVFKNNQKIYFGKVTFLCGLKNASGKSTILNFINSLSNYKHLQSWIDSDSTLNYEVEFFNPDKNKFSIDLSKGELTSKLNNNIVNFNPIPMVIYRFDLELRRNIYSSEHDDLDSLSQYLNVDSVQLKELIRSIGKSKYSKVSKAFFEYQEPEEDDCDFKAGNYLKVILKGRRFPISFAGLSSGEQSMLLMELIIERVQTYAKHTSCVLLVNLQSTSFYDETFSNYLKFFMSSEIDFQTVITSVRKVSCSEMSLVNNYSLEGSMTDVSIEPVII